MGHSGPEWQITSKSNLHLFWTRDLTPKKYRSHGGEAMGMERYKGFLIDGSAIPSFVTRFDWYSQGTIFRTSRRLDSIVEIKRIEFTAQTFKTKKQAEKHGLELCKEWIDKRP